MSRRIADQLSRSDKDFLKAINFIPPQPKIPYTNKPEPLDLSLMAKVFRSLTHPSNGTDPLELLLFDPRFGGKPHE